MSSLLSNGLTSTKHTERERERDEAGKLCECTIHSTLLCVKFFKIKS